MKKESFMILSQLLKVQLFCILFFIAGCLTILPAKNRRVWMPLSSKKRIISFLVNGAPSRIVRGKQNQMGLPSGAHVAG
jgi:hypothetical protein